MGYDYDINSGRSIGIYYRLFILMIPMLRTMPFRQAARVTVIGDTASIAAMETVENLLAFIIPGFMNVGPTDALFWWGMGIILPAGYGVVYPAMYWGMKREQKKGSMHHH